VATWCNTAGGIAVALIFARALGGSLADLVPRGRELPTFWRKDWSGISRRPVSNAVAAARTAFETAVTFVSTQEDLVRSVNVLSS
jgi:hypothetical protein